MKDKYDPHAETPDDIFLEEMHQLYETNWRPNRNMISTKNRDTVPTGNTVTIPEWTYYAMIFAQFLCTGVGIGIGMMLKDKPESVPHQPGYISLRKPVHLERKDVNGDGIDDLILIDKDSKNYEIFIGQKEKSYVDRDNYYLGKSKEVDQKVNQEKDSIEEKIKQEYEK